MSFSEVLGPSLACAVAQGRAVCCCFLCVTLDIVAGGWGLPRPFCISRFLAGDDASGGGGATQPSFARVSFCLEQSWVNPPCLCT